MVAHMPRVTEAALEIRLDPSSAVPIYAQVVERVKSLVASRALRAGDQLPSVRDLATSLRVNRNTAAKAYQTLEMEGVIETRAGQGCYVGEVRPRWSSEERRRRLERLLDRVLVEAHLLDVPDDEVRTVLERRITAFAKDAPRPARRS